MRSHPRIKVEFIFTCGRDSDIFVLYNNWASHEVFKPLSNHPLCHGTISVFFDLSSHFSSDIVKRGSPLPSLETSKCWILFAIKFFRWACKCAFLWLFCHTWSHTMYWMKWYDGLMGQFLQVIKLKSKNIQGDSGSLLPLDELTQISNVPLPCPDNQPILPNSHLQKQNQAEEK